jgi:putative PIN family toxin of toxin-antitoxin system
MKRVVLDTNVLVSAILLKGRLSKLVTLWRNGGISPVISKETFSESKRVLSYPKFALSKDDIKAIIENEILPHFEVSDIKEKINGICRDPDDDMFLTVAVNAKAPFLVTGDKDLLELRKYKSIKIVSPQEYLALLKN